MTAACVRAAALSRNKTSFGCSSEEVSEALGYRCNGFYDVEYYYILYIYNFIIDHIIILILHY